MTKPTLIFTVLGAFAKASIKEAPTLARELYWALHPWRQTHTTILHGRRYDYVTKRKHWRWWLG